MQESLKASDQEYKEKYGFKSSVDYVYVPEKGLSENVIKNISKAKNEPEWMLEKRLSAYKIFKEKPMPNWGIDLSSLNFDDFYYYMKPTDKKVNDWNELPEEIKETFDKLGVPEAERKFFAGTEAQFDSEVVYSAIRETLERDGVIFTDTDTAVKKHGDIVKKFFGNVVPPSDNKFAALNTAVWSGGSFIYVPKGVKVKLPLQAYFRINAEQFGQFERTLIIADEGADVKVEWIDVNLGSKGNMKYPSIFLRGANAEGKIVSVAIASEGQIQDTGGKLYHLAPNTKSTLISKSVSSGSGNAVARFLVHIGDKAENAMVYTKCDAMLIDKESKATAYPYLESKRDDASLAHEASIGKISQDAIDYLMSRGISEDDAKAMIVFGFISDSIRDLPLDYLLELKRLVKLNIEKEKKVN